MEAVRQEIVTSLMNKHGALNNVQLEYIHRDGSYQSKDQRAFLQALKRCIDFAKARGLKLGPGRGSSTSSIVLYAMGLSDHDPSALGLYPERLSTQPPNIHIDVEYERGQEFVDFCREVTKGLQYGQIQAFKMPLLDILRNVDARLSRPVDYDAVDENSDLVLKPFRTAEIEKIFLFDFSKDALIMVYENFLPAYDGSEKMKEYLRGQTIHNFRDVQNIGALWRPHSQKMVERLENYASAKSAPFDHKELDPNLRESLKPNFGMVIYHEDLLRIISFYSQWDLKRCNQMRRDMLILKDRSPEQVPDFVEFRKTAPIEIADLILEQYAYSFCQPHAIAHSIFTKKTAILKGLHQEMYYEEIEKWEQKNGFRWDDIGVHWKGVSLLQY